MAADRARAARRLGRRAAAAPCPRARAGRSERPRCSRRCRPAGAATRSASTPRAAVRARAPTRCAGCCAASTRRASGASSSSCPPDSRGRRGGRASRASAEAWDEALAALPPDWSDLYAEVELTSTDHLERAALLLSPINPARYGDSPALRFRVARTFGYGASPAMVRRCLERMDAEGIRAQVRILRCSPTPTPSRRRGRSGTWTARRSSGRAGLLAPARAGPHGRRPPTARRSARWRRCSATASPTSSTA